MTTSWMSWRAVQKKSSRRAVAPGDRSVRCPTNWTKTDQVCRAAELTSLIADSETRPRLSTRRIRSEVFCTLASRASDSSAASCSSPARARLLRAIRVATMNIARGRPQYSSRSASHASSMSRCSGGNCSATRCTFFRLACSNNARASSPARSLVTSLTTLSTKPTSRATRMLSTVIRVVTVISAASGISLYAVTPLGAGLIRRLRSRRAWRSAASLAMSRAARSPSPVSL
jgi:hypothetical protein